jgi:hypothetical protein
MSDTKNDRRCLNMLVALLVFILLKPFLNDYRLGEFALFALMYITFSSILLRLHGKGAFRWLAILVAIPAMFALLVGLFHPIRSLVIVDYVLLMVFFGLISVGLFIYLGKPGMITSGRIYASVSLYLMLSTFWFALFNVIEAIRPGSFLETSAVPPVHVTHSGFFYFSLVTLTTTGFGDIVPVSPIARVFSALEGASGVLYIAITVARLVAAYQISATERQ